MCGTDSTWTVSIYYQNPFKSGTEMTLLKIMYYEFIACVNLLLIIRLSLHCIKLSKLTNITVLPFRYSILPIFSDGCEPSFHIPFWSVGCFRPLGFSFGFRKFWTAPWRFRRRFLAAQLPGWAGRTINLIFFFLKI